MAKPDISKEVVGKKLPMFVQYLTEPDTPYDCWFKVQDPDKPEDPPGDIGGSKLHLMSHSILFRRMLHESPLAEKGPITVSDISLSTFRHLLRFLHGYFDVTDLSLEEAVALLCASEKYFVDDLRHRLGVHISSLLSVNNIFLPMMTEQCFHEDTLKKAMQKIIQQETKKLVAKDEFLELNAVGILNIVTQDCLQISEIELWKAVQRWGKHQGGTEKTEELREVLTEPLKQMRFCTLDDKEFNKEVATTGILTDEEIATVAKILGGASCIKTLSDKNDVSALNSLSFNVTARKLYLENEFEINFTGTSSPSMTSSSFFLTTEEKTVHLLSMEVPEVKSSTVNVYWGAPKKSTFKVECQVTLTRITNYSNNTTTEQPFQFRFAEVVQLDSSYVIHFPKNTKLLPLNKYKLALSFNSSHAYLRSENKNVSLSNKCLLVTSYEGDYMHSHVLSLKYKLGRTKELMF